jgi:hypothetical protein
MNTWLDALGTVENGSGSAKHENWTIRPRNRWKWVQKRKPWEVDATLSVPLKTGSKAQNMKTGTGALDTAQNVPGAQSIKTGPDALNTVENESRCIKHEIGPKRLLYRKKRIWRPRGA